MGKTMCCPRCKSTNIQIIGQNNKRFSVGKAVAGAVLLPGIGALAGFAGKKGKYDVFCNYCGYRWQTK